MGIPVAGYENYLVEPDGRIFSLITNKFLKENIGKTGYRTVELFNDNGSKRLLVHRIVATAFIPNPDGLPQINHKDENKANNHVENLEWCSAKYNMNYGEAAKTRHLKIDYTTIQRKVLARENGKKACVPVLQFDKNGKFINRYESVKDAYEATNILHISECCHNRRKTAGGYVWKSERSDDLSVFQF